ncbi:MAG: dipeptidase PepE [Patescibacteria group bacterium]
MDIKLLLISNSKTFGKGYLDHCTDEIKNFINGPKEILFIPYALKDYDIYADIAEKKFMSLGYGFTSLHRHKNKKKTVQNAKCIFIGGGNTFRLLNTIYKEDLIKTIRRAVFNGTQYIGSSAGSNIACPTIKTTNDMPIIQPPSFEALSLITFQINPHYIDNDPKSTHMGETREQRIIEYHEENDTPVVGLRENSLIRVENNRVILKGTSGAKIFIKGRPAYDLYKNTELPFKQF